MQHRPRRSVASTVFTGLIALNILFVVFNVWRLAFSSSTLDQSQCIPRNSSFLVQNQGPRYLLALEIYYREQTTQFVYVIHQLMKLAKLTGRTLVLPYVANSHIWSPGHKSREAANVELYPFSYYFELTDPSYVPAGIIDMDEYLARTGINREAAVFYTACYASKCTNKFSLHDCSKGPESHAIKQLTDKFWRVVDSVCFSLNEYEPSDVLKLMNEKYASYDIAFAHYHKNLLKNDDIPQLLRVSPTIMQAVNKFKATQLSGGYISVHWRFEKTVKAHTFKILPALIHYIKQKAADTGISHVFLATEYPSHGSDSWDENDREAKKPVYLELVAKLKETLTVVEGYSGELKDAGAIAIADRVLAEDADGYVPIDYGSSFTRGILEVRKKAWKKNFEDLYDNYSWPDAKLDRLKKYMEKNMPKAE